jgi:hypothetical protein
MLLFHDDARPLTNVYPSNPMTCFGWAVLLLHIPDSPDITISLKDSLWGHSCADDEVLQNVMCQCLQKMELPANGTYCCSKVGGGHWQRVRLSAVYCNKHFSLIDIIFYYAVNKWLIELPIINDCDCSHSTAAEDLGLLGSVAVSLVARFLAFWSTVVRLSLGSSSPFFLKCLIP